MFNYFECRRCSARLASRSAVPGAYATPRCGNGPCTGAQMKHIVKGLVGIAPPRAPAAPFQIPNLDDQVRVTYAGNGSDRGWAIR